MKPFPLSLLGPCCVFCSFTVTPGEGGFYCRYPRPTVINRQCQLAGKEGKEVNWKAESIFLECVIIKEEFITVPTSSTPSPLHWTGCVLFFSLLCLSLGTSFNCYIMLLAYELCTGERRDENHNYSCCVSGHRRQCLFFIPFLFCFFFIIP